LKRRSATPCRTDVGLRLFDLDGARGDVLKAFGRFADSTRVDFPGRFSRSGKQVAFASDRTGQAEACRHLVIDAAIEGNSDVYVISIDSRVSVRLTSEPAYDGLPEWSADGRWIYFTSLRSGSLKSGA